MIFRFLIQLINCELTFDLIWSAKCVIFEGNRETTFVMTNAKLYVPVVTLSTKGNGKLLQQFKPGLRGTINGKKYLSRIKTLVKNRYLHFFVSPNYQGVNKLFALSFENEEVKKDSDNIIFQL